MNRKLRRPILRIVLLCALGTFFVSVAYADRHRPPRPSGHVDVANHARLFLRSDEWNHMLSLDWRFEQEAGGVGRRSATLGTYYRVHRNLKVGGFYQIQTGVRHDDDWVSVGDGFEWQDTSGRFENVLMLDITPRFLLDFLPGESWVLSWKNRLAWNSFNNHLTVRSRPGLTYVLLFERQPLVNVSLGYDAYVSLNFGESLLYRQYPYVHLLYHATPEIKFDVGFGVEDVVWSTSEDVRNDPDRGAYSVSYRPYVLSLGAIFSVEL